MVDPVLIPGNVKKEMGFSRLGAIEKYLIRLRLKGFRSSGMCVVLWMFNIDGFGRKLRFFWETLFPRKDVMRQIYPDVSVRTRPLVLIRRLVEMFRLFFITMKEMVGG